MSALKKGDYAKYTYTVWGFMEAPSREHVIVRIIEMLPNGKAMFNLHGHVKKHSTGALTKLELSPTPGWWRAAVGADVGRQNTLFINSETGVIARIENKVSGSDLTAEDIANAYILGASKEMMEVLQEVRDNLPDKSDDIKAPRTAHLINRIDSVLARARGKKDGY